MGFSAAPLLENIGVSKLPENTAVISNRTRTWQRRLAHDRNTLLHVTVALTVSHRFTRAGTTDLLLMELAAAGLEHSLCDHAAAAAAEVPADRAANMMLLRVALC